MNIWRAVGLDQLVLRYMQNATDLSSLIFTFLQVANQAQQREIVMMLWAIWKGRNDKVWHNEEKEALMCVMLSRQVLFDWENVKIHNHRSPIVQQQASSALWQKLNHGMLKCNVDAAIFSAQQRFGFGMCIRNKLGEFVQAKTMVLDGVVLTVEAQARKPWEALSWVGSLGLNNVNFELDCKFVVDNIHGESTCQTEAEVIINTYKEKLRQFRNYSVSFIRRQANSVAHFLARASKFYASHQIHDYIPACIVDLILNEMT